MRAQYFSEKYSLICTVTLGISWSAYASDLNSLDDAPLLDDQPVEIAPAPKAPSTLSSRSYGYIQWWYQRRKTGHDVGLNPVGQLGSSLHGKSRIAWAIDGNVDFASIDQHYHAETPHLNQIWARSTVGAWALTLGKERTKQAPALLITPSDFIDSSQALPGMLENRDGTWQVRLSYLSSHWSSELIVLPIDQLRRNGLPDDRLKQQAGWAWRNYLHIAGNDLGVTIGSWSLRALSALGEATPRYNRNFSRMTGFLGLSAQRFVTDNLKCYGEAGSMQHVVTLLGTERGQATDYALGLEYMGSNLSLRSEYLLLERGLNSVEFSMLRSKASINAPDTEITSIRTMLSRQRYMVINLMATEFFSPKISNITTAIIGLEDENLLALNRITWDATDALRLGETLTLVHSVSNHDQFSMIPFHAQISLDAQYFF